MSSFRILVVEDDEAYGELLERYLGMNPDHEVKRSTSGKDALRQLKDKPDALTLDLGLPDMAGIDLFRRIRNDSPETQIVIISGHDDLKTAVALLKEGAYDYIIKDSETRERLWNTMVRIRENSGLRSEIASLRKEVSKKYLTGQAMLGNSPAMQNVFRLVEKAAMSNITVSLTGETGTGKDMVAKSVHYLSDRGKKPFVAVNVAAIPSELAESELFGHEKGAFTGAAARKIGKFEEANGGTLFLDEIGEMDLHLQTKLLRVLQERELVRVGGNETVKLDIRVIAATHRNLDDEVQQKRFREDLYYRLLGLPIELPPLRDRGKDILLLARYFIETYCKENKIAEPSLSLEASEKLMNHRFPGNVRELKAAIELSVVMCNGAAINPDDIRFRTPSASADLFSEDATLEEYSLRIVRNYLARYNNNIQLVAQKLGIGRSTIYRMLRNETNGPVS